MPIELRRGYCSCTLYYRYVFNVHSYSKVEAHSDGWWFNTQTISLALMLQSWKIQVHLLTIIHLTIKKFDSFIKIGLKNEAKWYLSKFSWGHAFLELNNELLERYSSCASSKEILQVQDDYLEKAQAERNDRRNQCDLLIPSDTSDDSDDTDDNGDGDGDDDKSKEEQQ